MPVRRDLKIRVLTGVMLLALIAWVATAKGGDRKSVV